LRTTRRILLAAAAFLLTAQAHASGFDRAAFDAARDEGRTVIVDVYADWCPVCRAQKPIVEALAQDPAFAEARFVTVDFDADKEVVRELGVRAQSTLIVLKGGEEKARATGITDPAEIRALLEKGL
jgi:thiol-disulfide isomerase/thioredoxin